jgi:hypothetical protein
MVCVLDCEEPRVGLRPLPLLGCAVLLGSCLPGRTETLYTLKTSCSINGTNLVPCTIVAADQGDATIYSHVIGSQKVEIRITDKPVTRIETWEAASKRWVSVVSAAARFSKNAVCFNGTDLCAVNPNYLNSVQQSSPATFAGRDLVRVHFGADGRVDASCYDAGCDLITGKGS